MGLSDHGLIPLSEAAKIAGCTPQHLNLLAREGKLNAKKVGRNWFTKKTWLDQYFSGEEEGRTASEIELRKIEMQERVELAKVQAELEKAKMLYQSPSAHSQSQSQALVLNGFWTESGNTRAELEALKQDIQTEQKKLNREKLLLQDFVKKQILSLQRDLREEQGRKEALLFAFENLQNQVAEDLERKAAEMYFQISEKFSTLLGSHGLRDDQEWRQKMLQSEKEKKELAKFFAEQLNEIRKNISSQTLAQKQQTSSREDLVKKRREQSIQKLELLKKHLAANLSSRNESASQPKQDYFDKKSPDPDQNALKLSVYFENNLVMIDDEHQRAEHYDITLLDQGIERQENINRGTIQYKTVFLKPAIVKATSGFPNANQMNKWQLQAMHQDGVHYILKNDSQKTQHKVAQTKVIVPTFKNALPTFPKTPIKIAILVTGFAFAAFVGLNSLVAGNGFWGGFEKLAVFGQEDTILTRNFDTLQRGIFEIPEATIGSGKYLANLLLPEIVYVHPVATNAEHAHNQLVLEKNIIAGVNSLLSQTESVLDSPVDLPDFDYQIVQNFFDQKLVSGRVAFDTPVENKHKNQFVFEMQEKVAQVLLSYKNTFINVTEGMSFRDQHRTNEGGTVAGASIQASEDESNFLEKSMGVFQSISNYIQAFVEKLGIEKVSAEPPQS